MSSDLFSTIMYGAVGFFGALAVILFGVGLVIYFVRLGTEGRAEGVTWMERAVVVSFVLAILSFVIAYFGI